MSQIVPAQTAHRPMTFSPTISLSGKLGWRLVFSDEFEGYEIDPSKWLKELPWGTSNPPEAQLYVPDAFELQDGVLRIKADRQKLRNFDFSSGVITSNRFKLLYGYVEMRARIPAGQGLWSAFWLVTDHDPSVAEIDIFEFLGHQPNVQFMALHYHDAQGEHQDIVSNYSGPDFSKAFHTFAINWSPDEVRWYMDGIEKHRLSKHIPQEPLYLVANLAVGGEWPGYPDSTTRFPAYFDIDYIKVYQPRDSQGFGFRQKSRHSRR